MHYYKLSGGIFIDYGCNGVLPIKSGVLLPGSANCSDIDKEYKKDLHAFLTRWFGGVEETEGFCGRVTGPMSYGSNDGVSNSERHPPEQAPGTVVKRLSGRMKLSEYINNMLEELAQAKCSTTLSLTLVLDENGYPVSATLAPPHTEKSDTTGRKEIRVL